MRKHFTVIAVFTLVIGFLVPFVGGWQRTVDEPCSECHVAPKTLYNASITIDSSGCYECHSLRFPPPITDANYTHYVHSGLRIGTGPGNMAKHMSKEEADAVEKDMGWCAGCHLEVSCMECHARQMPHIHGRSDCESCHGSLPYLFSHFISLPATSSHSVGGLSCYSCHSSVDVDAFILASGVRVTQPNDICRQCHSDVYREWMDGKHYDLELSCTHEDCHDPHSPHLPPPEERVHVQLAQYLWIIIAVFVASIVVSSFFIWRRVRKGTGGPAGIRTQDLGVVSAAS